MYIALKHFIDANKKVVAPGMKVKENIYTEDTLKSYLSRGMIGKPDNPKQRFLKPSITKRGKNKRVKK